MEKTLFENLAVYQLSGQLSDLAWKLICKWGSLEKDTIGKQLVRSTDSIGANIAEGSGRGSKKDKERFAIITRWSLFEVKHWLRRAYRQKLLSGKEISHQPPAKPEAWECEPLKAVGSLATSKVAALLPERL